MKRLALLFLLVFLVSFSYSQDIVPGPTLIIKAGTTPNNVHIPYVPNTNQASTRSVQITVDYIDDATSTWTPDAMAAFDYAVGIMEETLESAVTIEVEARFEDLGDPDILGSASAVSYIRNFSGNGPAYFDDTYYPFALASKLTGNDVSPSNGDINANFNSTFSWYFGTDGGASSSQHDFVTVVLHELCHGVGWASSAVADMSGNLTYGLNAASPSPTIYDRFIENGDEVALTDFDMGTSSADLTSYLLSDNLFWNSSSSADAAKLFAPAVWEGGSSISHLDDATYDPTDHALMTHELAPMESFHNPGSIGVDILSDIGWEAILVTGIEDDLTIHSFDVDCWTNSGCPYSFWEMLGNNPPTVLNVGDTKNYSWWFIDEYPYNGTPNLSWRLEVLHNDGIYVLDECPSGECNSHGAPQTWEVTVPDLPSGYDWSRNFDNQIKAKIVLSGSDQYGYYYEEQLNVAINYRPDYPEVEFIGNHFGEVNCESVTLAFYARGADYHNIHYKPENGLFWFTEVIPSGTFSYTFTGLDESLDYLFMVEGINSYGASQSDKLTREACKIIIAEPNLSRDKVKFHDPGGEGIIKVELMKLDNPSIGKVIQVDGEQSEVHVPLNGLPAGTYNALIFSKNGGITNKLIIKI